MPNNIPTANGGNSFQTLVLNRADGLYYAGLLRSENGGLKEYFSHQSLVKVKKQRIDQQLGGDFTLKYFLSHWGYLIFDGGMKIKGSTLSKEAPVWIPKWDWSMALKWTGSLGRL